MFPHASEAVREAPARLSVTRLALRSFRCYETARLDADARPVVLHGENGAGKTNLLEALSYLTPGKGLRGAKLAEVDRSDGEGPWTVAATVEGPRGEVRLGTGRAAAPPLPASPRERGEGNDRRIVKIDGEAVRGQAALAEHFSVVWVTPQMDRLFLDGASPRRRFLDRLVWGFDPEHASRVATYDHALRERARLLRDGPADPAWLTTLEDRMARHGVAIAAARRDVAARLDAVASTAPGPFPRARLAATGEVEASLASGPALDAEERLKAALEAARPRDAELGGAGAGPHRSDFSVHHATTGKAAAEGSTGEQKALLLAVLLAHARLQTELRGAAPVLLLDEVAAHLDELRRHALFGALLDLGAQAWLTGTDAALFAPLRGDALFVRVHAATLTPE